jgi:hypothetical protein
MKLETAKDVADIVKKVVEIVAIGVAAWWAYTRYFSGEAPSLEEHAAITLNVNQGDRENASCQADVHVEIKNIGKRSFDVHSILIRIWVVDIPELFSDDDYAAQWNDVPIEAGTVGGSPSRSPVDASAPKDASVATVNLATPQSGGLLIADAGRVFRLDPDKLMAANPAFYSETLPDGESVTGHYSPDTTMIDDYWFALPVVYKKMVIYRVTARATSSLDNTKNVTIDEWRWFESCTDNSQPANSSQMVQQQSPASGH